MQWADRIKKAFDDVNVKSYYVMILFMNWAEKVRAFVKEID